MGYGRPVLKGKRVPRRRVCGFTLIEVIVVMAIMAILAAVAVPGILSYLPGYRLRADTRDLLSAIRQGRAEAVKRNQSCRISFNQPIGGTTYSYVVWVDSDADGILDPGEQIVSARFSPGVSFDPSQGGGDGIDFPGNRIVFTSRGMAEGSGAVWLTNGRGGRRQISLTLAGASRIES